MNILFVGPYRQQDEWGYRSQFILHYLNQTEHNIVSRPIYLNSSPTYNAHIEKSEFVNNENQNYDILIQYMLPSFAVYQGEFKKRIGIFHHETIPNDIPRVALNVENLMDEIWVDSKIVAKNLQDIFQRYKISTIVKPMPPVLNLDNLPPDPQVPSIRNNTPAIKDRFIFYYIGNIHSDRSGFKEIYTAYLNTFTKQDPVALVVYLDTPTPPNNIQEIFDSYRKRISFKNSPLHDPLVHVINPQQCMIQPTERLAMHKDGDCMIHLDYAMTHTSTILEGALYQNTPIINQNNALHEWLGDEHFWCVNSYEDLCTLPPNTAPPGLYRYTTGESWYRPIVKSLSETMKVVYTDKFQRDKKRRANSQLRQYLHNTSYNNLINI